MIKGKKLDTLKRNYFGNTLTLPGANIGLLMEKEYFSANIDAKNLLLNIVKSHIELGYIFALQ